MPDYLRQPVRMIRLIGTICVLILLVVAPAAPASAGPANATTTHVVAWGETLYSIARQYGASPASITSANNLANPDQLYAGQTLIIPGSGGAAVSANPTSGGRHVVQAGENLYRIGLKYSVTVEAMMTANALVNADQIYVGQVLAIPGTGGVLPAANSIPASSVKTHVVKVGQTLSGIASLYGITAWGLAQANNISNPSLIYAGQVLIIPNGAAAQAKPAPPAATIPAATLSDGKQIIVDLSEQRTYAYKNGQLLRSFLVSTGLPVTPTVTGDFAIYVKYDSQTMTGPGYSLPGVPWVMYFYRGYGLHGTYWHDNFGQPMSHGCVNLTVEDARWLYNWAPIGTAVRVVW